MGGTGAARVDDRIVGSAMAERAVADEVDAAQLREARDRTARRRILARREATAATVAARPSRNATAMTAFRMAKV